MIVLEESTSSQTFKVIPRELDATSMVITNELTDVSVTYNINPTVDRYYLVITSTIALKENNFYKLRLLNGLDTVYLGKIYCTNQPVATYSVNNGEYTTYSSNNDYITYE